MQVKSVHKTRENYLIYYEDDSWYIQRRSVLQAIDPPMTAQEKVIADLCDKLCPPSTSGGE